MSSTFEAAIDTVLLHEGSKFTNIAGDPGGPTKYGITLHNAQLHNLDIDHDGQTTEADIELLTREDAMNYYHLYWWHSLYEQINAQEIATKVFDTAVNVGEHKAYVWLQQALNKLLLRTAGSMFLGLDGSFGPKTLSTVNAYEPSDVLSEYRKIQADFYIQWVNYKYDVRQKFLQGLLNRARS